MQWRWWGCWLVLAMREKTSARPILMLMLLKKNVTHKKMKHTRNWKMKLTRKWNSQETEKSERKNETHKKLKNETHKKLTNETEKCTSQESEKWRKKTRLTRNWTKSWLRLVWSPTRLSRGRSQCLLILNFSFLQVFILIKSIFAIYANMVHFSW